MTPGAESSPSATTPPPTAAPPAAVAAATFPRPATPEPETAGREPEPPASAPPAPVAPAPASSSACDESHLWGVAYHQGVLGNDGAWRFPHRCRTCGLEVLGRDVGDATAQAAALGAG